MKSLIKIWENLKLVYFQMILKQKRERKKKKERAEERKLRAIRLAHLFFDLLSPLSFSLSLSLCSFISNFDENNRIKIIFWYFWCYLIQCETHYLYKKEPILGTRKTRLRVSPSREKEYRERWERKKEKRKTSES